MARQSTSRTELHCETYGSGDPILCLHGLGASSYTWRNFIEPLSKDYKLILIDLKGFGESPKPRDKRYSVYDHADLVYHFILENDLRNLTLMGNSYGGAVSLLLATKLCEEDRNRLSKLILIDSAAYNECLPWHLKFLRTPLLGWLSVHLMPSRLSTRRVLRYVYHQQSLITEEQAAIYAKPIRMRGGRHALLHTARQAIPKDIDELTPKYATICVPTLIVWGEKDRIIPLKIGEMLDAAIPSTTFVVLPGVGHAPQEEAPEKTIPLILEFLSDSADQ